MFIDNILVLSAQRVAIVVSFFFSGNKCEKSLWTNATFHPGQLRIPISILMTRRRNSLFKLFKVSQYSLLENSRVVGTFPTELYWYTFESKYAYMCVYFQKDLRPNPSHLNTNIRHSNTRSTRLKLIYIISSIYKPKIKCFEYFLPMHQVGKNERPKWVGLV